MKALLDAFLHIDVQLAAIIAQYGSVTYALLFGVVFLETGLVVMPFLPGDSLLFAAGAFAASGSLSLPTVLVALFAAAFFGDSLNYRIGRHAGVLVLRRGSLFGIRISKEHLDRTTEFYARHGDKTIVIARFMPFVRTFAPFVAGAAGMDARRFIPYNAFGGALWVASFVLAGYFFGNIPAVKENFTHVIIAIVILSLIPPAIEFFRSRKLASVK